MQTSIKRQDLKYRYEKANVLLISSRALLRNYKVFYSRPDNNENMLALFTEGSP